MGGRGSSSKSGGGGGGSLTESEKKYMDMINGGPSITIDGKESYVPEWIQKRESLGNSLYVVRQTDKAVLVKEFDVAQTGRRNQAWVPKRVLQTKKEYAAAGVASQKRFISNAKYTKYLKDLAKSSGVKIGNTSSWEKITDKLKKNGVRVKSRNEF